MSLPALGQPAIDPCRAPAPFSRPDEIARALESRSRALREGQLSDEAAARTYVARSFCLERLGQTEAALQDLDAALRLAPASMVARQGRAEIEARLGRHKEAVADFDEVLKAEPKSVVARHGRASSLTILGEPERAIEDLDEALRLDPRYTPALLGRGEAHARAGRHTRALQDYTAYLAANAEDAYAHYRRGISYSRSGQLRESIADLGEAIRLDARLVSAYIERGRAYARLAQPEQAVLDFGEAVSLAPRFALAHNELAWLLATSPRAQLRDGRKAVEHARTAAELASWTNPGYLDTYAAALAEAGEFDEAVKWQTRALELPGFGAQARAEASERLELYRSGKPYRMN